MDHTDVLRALALHDERSLGTDAGDGEFAPAVLDAKTVALVRLAALVALGGAAPTSYGAHSDAAIVAGATVGESVEVLTVVLPVVGLPRVVAAAPSVGLALGYDVEDALG